jgi:diacylglycerol kinase (ATP)
VRQLQKVKEYTDYPGVSYCMSALAATRAAALRREHRPRVVPVRSGSPILVANANASGYRKHPELLRLARRVLEAADGHHIEVHLTGSVEELGQAALEEERRLVLLGGDGTLHALANLRGHKPELALLPNGGANNIARSLGIPTDLRAAAELAVHGRARPLDAIVASADRRRYVAVEGISVGYHALARTRYRAVNSTDTVAALTAAVSALRRFRPICVAVEADGEAMVGPIGQLFVANTPLFGPRLLVAPGADPGDGYLDLVRIETRGRASLLAALARLRRGTHAGGPGVSFKRARRVRITTGGRSPVIADTVDLGSGPIDLVVDPAALAVVAPGR